ncbi:type II toxin-antitoxin system death-on-curing family toxin [Staphylococcus aureus]|uniref:type II toxin-antitoxin system death-on-curing family toxin n=1 Tax=Staphylococcus aureus TaxID=1280 RepID=UPI0025534B7F|nr:type II toxin-antitoxin system death-on-curing family toxin [Staphylococcus aureus]WIO53570.1 type II toxin-antitoxin system death-on-curing family toxin [Staphylococcus aureus]WIO65163.1 type II toxin-antitoxin system death-on-curing family toxin [Staphylococcus aureus]WIO68068.1 type II toxin-antitoxin system death-on-curing family toxin [Staphylococcus aureus]HDE7345530.1 type II toxin-antitoxin system death-on-curing family toxin [Staphylococcus aureus]HDE7346072.1 type II toxin-antitox
MQNIKYLTEKQVIAINVKAIQELSPKEQVGVKVPEVLNATIEGVKQSFGGVELYETIERKAAFIYRNIAQKHAFFNANKRTAFTSMVIFLKLNKINFNCTQDEVVQFTLKVVEDKTLTLEDIADWIKRHCK